MLETLDSKEKMLRPNIVAKMLDVSRMTVYRLFQYGELEGLRTSPRNIRIYKSSVFKYLEKINQN
ncbi:MAG: helix-turn-helix transcriptional regulator [bacterium]